MFGEYYLQSVLLGDVCFIVYVCGKGGLINFILVEYVIVQEVYVIGESKFVNFGCIDYCIELGGVFFEGFYQKIYDLFIDRIWIFDVCEFFLDVQIVVYVDESGGCINIKIFIVLDFIVYVDLFGVYLCVQFVGYVVLYYVLEVVLVVLLLLDLVFEVYVGLFCELYICYLYVIIVDVQLQLQQEVYQVQMVFIVVIVLLGFVLLVEVYEVYNIFVEICS